MHVNPYDIITDLFGMNRYCIDTYKQWSLRLGLISSEMFFANERFEDLTAVNVKRTIVWNMIVSHPRREYSSFSPILHFIDN
jgi:hypothetical protein